MKRGLQKVSELLPAGLSQPSCFTLSHMIVPMHGGASIIRSYLKSSPVLQTQIFTTQERIRRKQIRKMVVQVHQLIGARLHLAIIKPVSSGLCFFFTGQHLALN